MKLYPMSYWLIAIFANDKVTQVWFLSGESIKFSCSILVFVSYLEQYLNKKAKIP